MIKMTVNDVVIRHNFITKVQFKDGDSSLGKDLKIKVMSMRIEYGKVHKEFDDDVQEFTKGILEDRFNELSQIEQKNEEEQKEYNELVNKYNNETNEYIAKRALEEVEVNEYTFTKEEFEEIMETNASNDVNINGNAIDAPDFLEAIYTLFVKE